MAHFSGGCFADLKNDSARDFAALFGCNVLRGPVAGQLDCKGRPELSERFGSHWSRSWEKVNQEVSKPGGFPLFPGKVRIASRKHSKFRFEFRGKLRENFGTLVSNFASFFGNFVQQRAMPVGGHLRRQAICEDCRLLAIIRLEQGNRHVVEQLQVWAAERRCDLEAAPNPGESRGILVNNADCTNALKDPAARLFISRDKHVAIVSRSSRKSIDRYAAERGIAQIYLCKWKWQGECIAALWGGVRPLSLSGKTAWADSASAITLLVSWSGVLLVLMPGASSCV